MSHTHLVKNAEDAFNDLLDASFLEAMMFLIRALRKTNELV